MKPGEVGRGEKTWGQKARGAQQTQARPSHRWFRRD